MAGSAFVASRLRRGKLSDPVPQQACREEAAVAGINTSRVVIGGLIAGLIINVSEYILNVPLFGTEMDAALKALNLPPVGGNTIAVFVTLSFVLGVLLVWLYAAIRPRFGAGPKTAASAGIVVWFLAYFWSAVSVGMLGLFPSKLLLIGLVWGLVELIVAGVVGAYFYSET